MHKRPWELGPGTVLVAEAPEEVAGLPLRSRRLVPQRMIDVFRRWPEPLEALAREVASPSFAAWLRSAAASSAAVAVYLPRAGMPKRAFLELDFGIRQTLGGPLPWKVLVDCQTAKPPHCPPALAEVYTSLGGLVHQYGGSGSLLSPRDVRQLSRMGAQVSHLFDMRLEPELSREEGDLYYPYYEVDGDYLCYDQSGASRWFGIEWVESREPVPTERCVEALFRSLLDQQLFHG